MVVSECHRKSAYPGSLGLLSLSNQGSLFYESYTVAEPDGQQYLLSFCLDDGQIQVILLWLKKYYAHLFTIDGNNWGVECARYSWTILWKWVRSFLGHLPCDNTSFICEHMDLMKLSLGEHGTTGLGPFYFHKKIYLSYSKGVAFTFYYALRNSCKHASLRCTLKLERESCDWMSSLSTVLSFRDTNHQKDKWPDEVLRPQTSVVRLH